MQPTINEGAIVYIDAVSNVGNIKLNDIIAFHSPSNWDTLIIHRVVEKIITTEGVILRTKGDNNPVRDPWQLQEEYVVGVVAEWE
jgi:signal peptidase I